MNILLNFYPVRLGGGQQVASNFLTIIGKENFEHNWFVYVAADSELHELAKKLLKPSQIIAFPYSYIKRITLMPKLKKIIKNKNIDLIYNYCPVLPIKNLPQVVWSVYGNLYYPEINFWQGNSGFNLLKKRLIDRYRLKNTLKADGLVVENENILKRAITLYNFPEDKIKYIPPSVREFDESSISDKYEYLKDINEFKILFLSSFAINKNLTILPFVAKELKNKNVKIKFLLSLNKNVENVKTQIVQNTIKLNVEEYFEYLDVIAAKHVHQVIKMSDCMILLSKLESFSNNVLEAFYFKKPLIISNEEWSKAACNDAAIFVNRNNAEEIAHQIQNLINNFDYQKDLVTKGLNRLKGFNTSENKVLEEVQFLEYIYESYEKRI